MLLQLKKMEWDIFCMEWEIIFGKFLMFDPQLLGMEEEFAAFILVGLVDLMLIYEDFL